MKLRNFRNTNCCYFSSFSETGLVQCKGLKTEDVVLVSVVYVLTALTLFFQRSLLFCFLFWVFFFLDFGGFKCVNKKSGSKPLDPTGFRWLLDLWLW